MGSGTIMAQVSDFGTSRVNTEQQAGILRTHELTHASTHQVCGTNVYVSEFGKIL
jgi:hypothetical protein